MLARRPLSAPEARSVFRGVAAGELSDLQAAALLAALKIRGETGAILEGAALALLEEAVPFPRLGGAVADCCGTGGDGAGTFNISTAVAFVAAEAGLPVVKHGNRASSSRCGSADLLERVGVRIEMSPRRALACLRSCKVTYLHAPACHPAVGRVAAVRRALGTRTVFNLLGPLLNPARPSFRLLGVCAEELVRPMAMALAGLGCEKALVVHGSGLDEVALHGPSTAIRIDGETFTDLTLTPEEAGLDRHPVASLQARGPAESARLCLSVLAGEGPPGPESAVAINAGALLWIAGVEPTLRSGARRAGEILRSGRARSRLDRLVEASRGA